MLALLLGIAFWFMQKNPSIPIMLLPDAATTTASVLETKAPARNVPEGYKEYHNGTYHLSLFYPDNLTAHEFPEEGGAMTVTFEYLDKKTASGFQIFIVPFSGGQITQERFKEDDPSGVMQNLKNIEVAGAVGASFNSQDKILGATYEIWFTHGGYLYEATTFKETQSMLDAAMSSVVFY